MLKTITMWTGEDERDRYIHFTPAGAAEAVTHYLEYHGKTTPKTYSLLSEGGGVYSYRVPSDASFKDYFEVMAGGEIVARVGRLDSTGGEGAIQEKVEPFKELRAEIEDRAMVEKVYRFYYPARRVSWSSVVSWSSEAAVAAGGYFTGNSRVTSARAVLRTVVPIITNAWSGALTVSNSPYFPGAWDPKMVQWSDRGQIDDLGQDPESLATGSGNGAVYAVQPDDDDHEEEVVGIVTDGKTVTQVPLPADYWTVEFFQYLYDLGYPTFATEPQAVGTYSLGQSTSAPLYRRTWYLKKYESPIPGSDRYFYEQLQTVLKEDVSCLGYYSETDVDVPCPRRDIPAIPGMQVSSLEAEAGVFHLMGTAWNFPAADISTFHVDGVPSLVAPTTTLDQRT